MERLDLTQILKDCPEGTKLYSPLFGKVSFVKISDNAYPILVKVANTSETQNFTMEGKFYNRKDAECLLFPSKENRDWSKFKVEQPKPKFEPFQKVLVRNHDGQKWKISLYSYYSKDFVFPHICIEDNYSQCIPYEGNEHLFRTTDKPKEE